MALPQNVNVEWKCGKLYGWQCHKPIQMKYGVHRGMPNFALIIEEPANNCKIGKDNLSFSILSLSNDDWKMRKNISELYCIFMYIFIVGIGLGLRVVYVTHRALSYGEKIAKIGPVYPEIFD